MAPKRSRPRDAYWLTHDAPELLSASAVCEITGLNHRTVQALGDSGELPVFHTRQRRFFTRQGLLDSLGLKRATTRKPTT